LYFIYQQQRKTICSFLKSHGDRLDRQAHPHGGDPAGRAAANPPTRASPRHWPCIKHLTPHSLACPQVKDSIDICCWPAIRQASRAHACPAGLCISAGGAPAKGPPPASTQARSSSTELSRAAQPCPTPWHEPAST
jgi:hypothetical protein